MRTCHICNQESNFFCSDGYAYMDCARLFNFRLNKHIDIIPSSETQLLMDAGKRVHNTYSKSYIRDWHLEPPKTVMINKKWILHGHVDFVHKELNIIRELKPVYTRKAYGQTLMYRLLYPNYIVQCEEYLKKRIFNLKADYNMAKVYLQRIIYSSEVIPPRLPNFPAKRCDFCPMFKDCMIIPDYSWKNEFTVNIKNRFPSIDLLIEDYITKDENT